MFRFQGNTKCQQLIILSIFFAMVELSQSCHRKVEYYHYPKKPPPPPPPPPHHYGGHKGPHGGHGGGYGHGHSGGYKHGGHGHGQHKGYGHHDPHDHGGGGGYGGGHGHHEDEGYGHQHKGYEPEGHGHGHEPYGGGGYGHEDEYSHRGHRHNGYGHGGGHDHGHGKGHGGKGGKGHRYKYQMYESMRYHDKGHPRHPPSHSHGHSHSYGHPSYSQNVPHYLKQGYGFSGPYPNTEYSSPVGSSVNPPTYSPGSFNTGILKGITVHQHLDAADTADLIRQNSKENEIVSNPTASDSEDVYGTSNENLDKPSIEFTIVPGISQEVGVEADFIDTSSGTQVDPTNFDLNLNFNSDLPVPFQRSAFDSKRVSNNGRKKRKRLSSRYRRREHGRKKGSNESLPPNDTETSQSVNKEQKVEPPPKLKTEQSKVDDQKKNVTKS